MIDARWMIAMSGLLVAAPVSGQDAPAGAVIFKQRCQMCHGNTDAADAGIGPNLFDVVGRKAGATAFDYSPAIKASKLRWDKTTLETFLSGPGKLVPGTKMPIAISDPVERASIVAYLSTLRR